MSAFAEPAVAWRGSTDPSAPLVVLLHGRGSNEVDIIGLADHLPDGPAYAAVRAPIAEGGGFAWFANRGVAHVPPGHDGSLHLAPPLALATDVLAKGWGVAHPLAGVRLTPGMVMLFGPRDGDELETVVGVVATSHTWASGRLAEPVT